MVAAIYARKSTDQSAVADEAKSVTRQIDHAKAYAVRGGWPVPESCIFVDDGISGAEFANRPGFMRLMASLKPRPPFQPGAHHVRGVRARTGRPSRRRTR
jgi:DNA invertase Pin-like site-specific DNA recombinase